LDATTAWGHFCERGCCRPFGELADLHRRGELSDEEFAAAKHSVLGASEESEPAGTTRMSGADARWSSAGRVSNVAGAQQSESRRAPFWRSRWVVGAAIFCGFMFAAVGTAAVPSSALWTGRLVCSTPYHLAHQSSNTSYGNTAQTSVSFRCVDNAGDSKSVGTFEIFGLQLALGALITYGVVVGVGSALRLRRSPGYP
jgi:hypothetical protein